jgi:hypothetical protein
VTGSVGGVGIVIVVRIVREAGVRAVDVDKAAAVKVTVRTVGVGRVVRVEVIE